MIKNNMFSCKRRFTTLLTILWKLVVLNCFIVLVTVSNVSANEQLKLSTKEKLWLSEHSVVRLGVDPDWAPFDFVDQHGYHQGVAADFLRLISKKLNLTIELTPDITWTQVLEKAKLKQIDLVSIAAQTPSRSEYLSYTKPVISSSSVIVINEQETKFWNIDSLIGKKVGVVKGYSAAELGMKTHTQLSFIEVDSVLEGLKKTATGELDAFIDNIGVVGHIISEHSLTSLRIAGDAGLGTLELAFGVRKDWPELVSILNKVLATIPSAESRVIRDRWIPIRVSKNNQSDLKPDKDFLDWLIPSALFLIVLSVIIALGRVLDRPVTDVEVQQLTKTHKLWLAVTFANMKISAKILIMLILVSAGSVIIFGYFDYQAAKETLKKESFNKLTAVREMKAQQIENYFKTLNDLVVTFSLSDTAIDAAKSFRAAFTEINTSVNFDMSTQNRLKEHYEKEFISRHAPNVLEPSELDVNKYISNSSATQYLQKKFILENPYATGEKHKFYRLEDGSAYDVAHTHHHPAFRRLLEKFG
ncbi:MAG: transporter substrate-binding domain-containing protein, partial [Gammaproteobacteria bacterium]|nr:transporter substrate-binding domain-containing protein [Gammaproteobacteria bacterium]